MLDNAIEEVRQRFLDYDWIIVKKISPQKAIVCASKERERDVITKTANIWGGGYISVTTKVEPLTQEVLMDDDS